MATSVRALHLRPCTTDHFMLIQLERPVRGLRESLWQGEIKIGFPNFWSTAVTTIIISLPLILQYLCVDTMLIYGVSL